MPNNPFIYCQAFLEITWTTFEDFTPAAKPINTTSKQFMHKKTTSKIYFELRQLLKTTSLAQAYEPLQKTCIKNLQIITSNQIIHVFAREISIHKLCSLNPSAKVLNISNLNPSTKVPKILLLDLLNLTSFNFYFDETQIRKFCSWYTPIEALIMKLSDFHS